MKHKIDNERNTITLSQGLRHQYASKDDNKFTRTYYSSDLGACQRKFNFDLAQHRKTI